MQSIIFMVYILIPLTFAIRNYQNSMIGLFNSGVPKVPNSQNIYDLYNKGKKRDRVVIQQKVNEEPLPESKEEDTVERDPQKATYVDLRRQNTINRGPPKLDFPIPGGHVGDYNPYPISLRMGLNGNGASKFASPPSYEAFKQYYPVPPSPQARLGNDILIQDGKVTILGGKNNVPVVKPKEYSTLDLEKLAREDYNGYNEGKGGYKADSNEFKGDSNGLDDENEFNQDLDEYTKVIDDLIPPENSVASFDQDTELQEIMEKYKRIKNSLNGKEKETPLGYIRGSKNLKDEFSVSLKGGINGVNRGSNEVNGGSYGVNGGSYGVNGGSYEVNRGSHGVNGGNDGVNRGHYGFNVGSLGVNGGSYGVNGGSIGVTGGSFGVNRGSYGVIGASNGVNGVSYEVNRGSYGVKGGSLGINEGKDGVNRGSYGVNRGSYGINGFNAATKASRQGYNEINTGNNEEDYKKLIAAFMKNMKAMPDIQKSLGWTSKSLYFKPEQKELVEKYQQILEALKGQVE